MLLRFANRRPGSRLLAGLAWAAFALPAAHGQAPLVQNNCTTVPAPIMPGYPNLTIAPRPGMPSYMQSSATPTTPGMPTTPQTPQTPSTPDMTAPTTPSGDNAMASTGAGDTSGFGAESASSVGGQNFSGVGYIDSAIPVTQYRLRVDAAWNDNRPDRADFFYPKCGCFRAAGLDPNAPGPASQTNPTAATSSVNYQEISNYFEYAVNQRFSGWVDIPVRMVDISFDPVSGVPTPNDSHGGLSDVQFGFKYAMLYEIGRVLTFQLRTYSPTGNASLGLGRNNWNLEPALLYYQRLTDRLFFEGELRDFIPIASADDFAGNVTRYGAGLSYLIYNTQKFRIAPVTEFVGWTVLSGKELTDTGVVSAAGDTIVNAKMGVRFGFGRATQPGVLSRADLYVGYGRALTGEVWYKDIFRTEFRLRF